MKCEGGIVFSRHAMARMFERSLRPTQVKAVIGDGQVIADYPSDKPYPSQLLLAHVDGRPIHVVVAKDERTNTCIVITAYEPEPDLWNEMFTRRLEP
jgi:hypothetical protein